MAFTFKILNPAWLARRLNRSLSADLTIGMLAVLLVIEGSFLYGIYQRQANALLADIEFKAEDYADKLGEVLAVPIWDFDDEQIEKVGKGFLQNELVARLQITNAQGTQMLRLENPAAEGPLIRRNADIRYNDQIIGRVEIALSKAAYARELNWLRNIFLLVLICSVLVFTIASGLLLRFFLRKPLNALAHRMDLVAQGNFSPQEQSLSYSELAEIGRAHV